jgi:hypothetical protein
MLRVADPKAIDNLPGQLGSTFDSRLLDRPQPVEVAGLPAAIPILGGLTVADVVVGGIVAWSGYMLMNNRQGANDALAQMVGDVGRRLQWTGQQAQYAQQAVGQLLSTAHARLKGDVTALAGEVVAAVESLHRGFSGSAGGVRNPSPAREPTSVPVPSTVPAQAPVHSGSPAFPPALHEPPAAQPPAALSMQSIWQLQQMLPTIGVQRALRGAGIEIQRPAEKLDQLPEMVAQYLRLQEIRLSADWPALSPSLGPEVRAIENRLKATVQNSEREARALMNKAEKLLHSGAALTPTQRAAVRTIGGQVKALQQRIEAAYEPLHQAGLYANPWHPVAAQIDTWLSGLPGKLAAFATDDYSRPGATATSAADRVPTGASTPQSSQAQVAAQAALPAINRWGTALRQLAELPADASAAQRQAAREALEAAGGEVQQRLAQPQVLALLHGAAAATAPGGAPLPPDDERVLNILLNGLVNALGTSVGDAVQGLLTGQPLTADNSRKGALIAFALGAALPNGASLLSRMGLNALAGGAETWARQVAGVDPQDPSAVAISALFGAGAGAVAEALFKALGRIIKGPTLALEGSGAPPSRATPESPDPAGPYRIEGSNHAGSGGGAGNTGGSEGPVNAGSGNSGPPRGSTPATPSSSSDTRWPADVSSLSAKDFAQLYELTYQGGFTRLPNGSEVNFPSSASKAAELYNQWAPADAKQLRELQQQHPHVPYPVVVGLRMLIDKSRITDLPTGTVPSDALQAIVANSRTGVDMQVAAEVPFPWMLPLRPFNYFTENINPKSQASEIRRTSYFPPGAAPDEVYRDFARALVAGNATYARQVADPRNPTVSELNDLVERTNLESLGIFVMSDPRDPTRLATMSATARSYGAIESLDGATYPSGTYLYLGQLTAGRLSGSGSENINALQALVANSAEYQGVALYTYSPLNDVYLKQGFQLTAVRYNPDEGRIKFHYRWHRSITPLAAEGASQPKWPRTFVIGDDAPLTVGERLPQPAGGDKPAPGPSSAGTPPGRSAVAGQPKPDGPRAAPETSAPSYPPRAQAGDQPLVPTIGVRSQPPLPPPQADPVSQFALGTAAILNLNPLEAAFTRTSDFFGRLTGPLSNWIVDIPAQVWDRMPEGVRSDLREIWTGQPATWMPESTRGQLDDATASALRNVTVVPDDAWQELPPDMQAQLAKAAQGNVFTVEQGLRLDQMGRQAILQAPLGIGSAIEWTLVGKNGSESLITKVAQGVDRLWQSPPVEIALGTSRAIGFLAHKGVTALMVLEAASGGPKIHLYNPVSRQPITEPALEALTIGYVPKTGGTIAVTLQGSLVPSASITFWASGPVMRSGIPRLDRKVDGDVVLSRVISTWQANPGAVGMVTKIGVPDAHWARGFTLRPAGEVGANPLVGMTSLRPDTSAISGGRSAISSVDAYSLGVIDPLGFLGAYDTVRVGNIAVTPMRAVNHLGAGFKASGGTAGFTVDRTAGADRMAAAAFQTNPAFNWSMRTESPSSFEVSPDGKRLNAAWLDAEGGSSVGMFTQTRGAFEVERSLYVDPATGWMAVHTADSGLPPLWINDRFANAIKAAGDARGGKYDAASFIADPIKASADQWVQALQTDAGRTRVADVILQLGDGDVAQGLKVLSTRVGDPTVRGLLDSSPEFFRSLADQAAGGRR